MKFEAAEIRRMSSTTTEAGDVALRLQFGTQTRVLHFPGDELVGSHWAIFELVKNAYDADAEIGARRHCSRSDVDGPPQTVYYYDEQWR